MSHITSSNVGAFATVEHVDTNRKLREAIERRDLRGGPRHVREARVALGIDDHIDLGDGGSQRARFEGAE